MKLLLQILWGWSVLANGAVGIQIGTIQTNNQNIKLMKMNFNNPAFLQAASNVGGGMPVTRFVFVEGQNQLELSSSGSVVIESVQDGELVSKIYEALNNTSVTINSDADTEVVIYGAVTKLGVYPPFPHDALKSLDVSKNTALTELYCYGCTGLTSLDVSNNTALTKLYCGGCTGLTSLDVSNNTALTELNCYDCTGLTSLDVSNNTALTELNCYGCTGLTLLDVSNNTALTELYCRGCTGLTSLDVSKNTALTKLNCNGCTGLTSLDVSKNTALTHLDCEACQNLLMLNVKNTVELTEGVILDQSMANLKTLQVAGTSAWAFGEIESWLSDFAPDNGTVYVDENTPQGVITEAEGKSWTVEYVSA